MQVQLLKHIEAPINLISPIAVQYTLQYLTGLNPKELFPRLLAKTMSPKPTSSTVPQSLPPDARRLPRQTTPERLIRLHKKYQPEPSLHKAVLCKNVERSLFNRCREWADFHLGPG
jgi:hypothetical protein